MHLTLDLTQSIPTLTSRLIPVRYRAVEAFRETLKSKIEGRSRIAATYSQTSQGDIDQHVASGREGRVIKASVCRTAVAPPQPGSSSRLAGGE